MTRSILRAMGALAMSALIALPAVAQDRSNAGDEAETPAEVKDEDIYKGIIPGKRDEKEHITRSASRKRSSTKVMWIGFLPQDTRTRVFVQTDGSPNYDMERGDDGTTITVRLPDAKLADRNLRRDIDARFYERAIKYIKVSGKGKAVTLTMTIEPGADPRVSTSGNYLNIDFAHSPKKDEK